MDLDLYNATTAVVRAVTSLSNHCHSPPEYNCSEQFKIDIKHIAEELDSFYGAINEARSILTNVSQGQVIRIISQRFKSFLNIKSNSIFC